MEEQFPEHMDLVSSKPLSVEEARMYLRPDEVLVQYVVEFEQSFMWIITNEVVRWKRLSLGRNLMGEQVAALRCGLDKTAWRGEGEKRCQELLKISLTHEDIENDTPLPFDTVLAYVLCDMILCNEMKLLKDATGVPKHLIIVATEPLSRLPFQTLPSELPKTSRFPQTAEEFARVKWLGLSQPITVIPSVASLRALRRDAKKSTAAKPYVGFGNPLLNGIVDGRHANTNVQIQAWTKELQSCVAPKIKQLCSWVKTRSVSGPPVKASVLQQWRPLPQTACELCAIGSLWLPPDELSREVRLGSLATEKLVKQLGAISAKTGRSQLQDYRVVHFATHGVVANEGMGLSEPGLVMTPPAEGAETDEDDGYLSASEITGLKLDADLVILSACNTASGTLRSKEALSGLARAFFYAGARAILVSHWEVYTNAAVELTTRTMGHLSSRSNSRRAEAMRSAIAGIIKDAANDNDAFRLHPSYWGAFSVVGEGWR
ncbi:MAG: CHAT domain-containing protein [Alphaproteobacteria bacterium]|nr:CHAT domain-containing protein [Alphaproteobacteria bacterium]